MPRRLLKQLSIYVGGRSIVPAAQKSDNNDELWVDVWKIGELFWVDIH